MKPHELYDKKLAEIIENIPPDLESNEATAYMKNLETYSKCRPSDSEELIEPTTLLGKIGAFASKVLNNETTRTVIKAGGAFAGVAWVTHATIKRDHVIERTALQQANQRNS